MFRPRELRPAQGFLTAYEVMDVRYGMLVLPAQPMGLNVGSFVFSHSKGLETFDFIYHTEGQFKRLLKDMIARQGDFLFEVPPGHVRFVLAEAVARTLDLNRTLPQDYERFIPLAGAAVSLPEQTMIYDLIEADKVKESVDIPAMTSRLLENELLASWVLTSELAPYLRKIDEIEGSVLVLTEHQKAEQKQSVYEEAEREIFTPQKRAVLKRCLEETALLFWRRDEKDLAEGALALALNISPDGRHTLARRLDFAASLVQYSFDKIISASLKTGPAREPFQHSDSGLILPAGLNKPEEGV